MPLLDRISRGKLNKPLRLMVHGAPGVGKSTFAAGAPKPIFLDIEKRTEHLDIDRLEVGTWEDCLRAMGEIHGIAGTYQTVVIDTVDALEQLIYQYLCRKEEVASIEDVGGGYGKGYTATVAEWTKFVRAMDALRDVGYTIVLLAHSDVRTFKNPEGPDYDRIALKMNQKSAAFLRERVDAVGYACFEDLTVEDKKTKRMKGMSSGERVLKFTHSAAYESKQGTSSLPDEVPLSWEAFTGGR